MQKKIVSGLIIAGSLMCVDAYAIDPGLYMGIMMGPAQNGGSTRQMQRDPIPTAASPKAKTAAANPQSKQFGTRVFLGYKFNQYAGFEGGFTYFSGITYSFKDNVNNYQAAAGRTARVRSADIVGKLDYSYSNTVGLFAKGGIAAVYTTTPGALNITNYHTVPSPIPPPPAKYKIIQTGSNTYTTKVSPTFAVGATYDFNQNWQGEFSITRLFTGGSVNSITLYALGFTYHFVNIYCGQFLCDNN